MIHNQTGSRWEAYVDNLMENVQEKIDRFEQYSASDDGKYRIEQIQLIATVAAAIILGMTSPFTVAVFAGAGIVIRSFSPEQLENVQETFFRISENLPGSVKALAIVISYTYTPILFPIAGGLCLGFEVGARLSPFILAKGLDKVAEHVGGEKSEDSDAEVVVE